MIKDCVEKRWFASVLLTGKQERHKNDIQPVKILLQQLHSPVENFWVHGLTWGYSRKVGQ